MDRRLSGIHTEHAQIVSQLNDSLIDRRPTATPLSSIKARHFRACQHLPGLMI